MNREIHIHIHDGDAKVANPITGNTTNSNLISWLPERVESLTVRVQNLESPGDEVNPDEIREVAKIVALADKPKKKPLAVNPPDPKHCGTKQGAAIALIADGTGVRDALVEAEVFPQGVASYNAGSFAKQHRVHIAAMKNLPPGQASFDYLQKHYRWGT